MSGIEIEIIYIGIAGANILELQIEINPADPRYIPWMAIDYAYLRADEYDFIIVMEDDIQTRKGTLLRLLKFNSEVDSELILIPNRIEKYRSKTYCPDLISMPGWKAPPFVFQNLVLREPINIHSGIVAMSSSRFKLAYKSKPFNTPTIIIGDYMASAFANIHAYQRIVRALPPMDQITLFHEDNWAERMVQMGIYSEDEIQTLIFLSGND